MTCPNCGNNPSHTDFCEYCGYALPSQTPPKMKRSFPLLTLLFTNLVCILLIIFCFEKLSLNGYSVSTVPRVSYSSPDILISDYLTTVKKGNPRLSLSFYPPEIVRYYSQLYKTNEDILWVLDEAYRSHIYDNYDYYWMDKSIDWTSKFYQGKLEKYDLRCDQGKDIRILFQFSTDDYTISKYYFELIKQDNNWYLLSVFS